MKLKIYKFDSVSEIENFVDGMYDGVRCEAFNNDDGFYLSLYKTATRPSLASFLAGVYMDTCNEELTLQTMIMHSEGSSCYYVALPSNFND